MDNLESDTVAWIRSYQANGGTVPLKSIWANDLRVKDAKRHGYYSKIKYYIRHNGTDLLGSQSALIHTVGNAVATNSGIDAGEYTFANGIAFDGTSYLDSGVPLSTFLNSPSVSMGYWSTVLDTRSAAFYNHMGARADATPTAILRIYQNTTDKKRIGLLGDNLTQTAVETATPAVGLVIANRTSATNIRLIVNGTAYTGGTTAQNFAAMNAYNIYLGTMNNNGTASTSGTQDSVIMHFIATGFTTTDEANFLADETACKAREGR